MEWFRLTGIRASGREKAPVLWNQRISVRLAKIRSESVCVCACACACACVCGVCGCVRGVSVCARVVCVW